MVYLDFGPSLPDGYGATEITAMVKDPRWIFVYWEVHEASPLALRVTDRTRGRVEVIPVPHSIGSWYIPATPDSEYGVEIGRHLPDRFIPLTRSRGLRTPRSGPAVGSGYCSRGLGT